MNSENPGLLVYTMLDNSKQWKSCSQKYVLRWKFFMHSEITSVYKTCTNATELAVCKV